MGPSRTTSAFVLPVVLSFAAATNAQADSLNYVATPISYPGSTFAYATGINDSGAITGVYYDSENNFHGFTDIGGTLNGLDYPDSTGTSAHGINNGGVIVGADYGSFQYGFVDNGGTFSDLIYPGSSSGKAYGINDSGAVVGEYVAGGVIDGMLYSGGVYQTVDVPGTTQTLAWGISNDGTIAGYYVDASGNEHGFVYSGDIFTTVDCPGDTSSDLLGINNKDQAVGSCGFSDGSFTNIIYASGVITTLNINEPDAVAYGINDSGEIVGGYSTDGGNTEIAFDAAISPEPATFGFAAGGLIVLIGLRRKRRQGRGRC